MSSESRCVLITGATRGIGRALVDRWIGMGHTVFGCGRSGAEINAMRSNYSDPHRFVAVDVASGEEVMKWADELLRNCGTPDLLVNNAGIINQNAPLWKVPEEEFSLLMRINVGGMANAIRFFLPAMIEQGRGVIVNMSSGWGRSSAPEVAPYCASKWAIEGLTQSLSQELPPGLAAVAVNPGIIDTHMLRSIWAEDSAGFPSPESRVLGSPSR